jgi:mRNA-degrading endonuclease RelE of RelBE toxin-antitoxin system
MTVTYSTKARNDLLKLDWRARIKIINELGSMEHRPDHYSISRISESSYYKIAIAGHVVIGQVVQSNFNIITVTPQKTLILPYKQNGQ